jgi:hypothetical protein
MRVKSAWAYLSEKGLSREQTAKKLVEDFGVAIETARRNVVSTINIFGLNNRAEKEGMRMIVYEMITKTFQLAAKKEDLKAMQACQNKIMKLFGLDRDDPDAPNFEAMEPGNYIIVLPEKQRKSLEQMIQNPGTINLNQTEYAEFKELAE